MTSIGKQWPKDFEERINKQFAPKWENFLSALSRAYRTSVRINREKLSITPNLDNINWASNAFFLNQRPNFSLDPLWHSGAYYVQEASSMFLEQVFKQIDTSSPRLILDLCAAPGGKSTHINSLIGENDLLVSNELIRSRVSVLHENLTKWGMQNHIISNNDPKHFGSLTGFFDVVVIDAPCSGEGLFRREPESAKEWSIENAQLCSARQRRIFTDSLNCLKEDGYLIYSTCTFNPEENEKNVAWLCEEHDYESIRIPIVHNWNINEVEYRNTYAYQFLPHKVDGEGFFVALLQKKSQTKSISLPKKQASIFNKTKNIPNDWLKTLDNKLMFQHNEWVKFIPKPWEAQINLMQQKLRLTKIGTHVASLKKNNFIPNHELALSTELNIDAFKTLNLSQLDALSYLSKESFEQSEALKGWQLVAFNNIPLGFINGLGNRHNNYYPKEWRLRTKQRADLQLWYNTNI